MELNALGSNKTTYFYDKPTPDLLETFESPFECSPEYFYDKTITIEVPEFTSLCPITGQPDFAKIIIKYKPNKLCVESKSLKLYMGSFRMHGEFHEACIARITEDLIKLLDPLYLFVEGQFTPRGGIPFWPKTEYIKKR
jgi:7-cyano-7-deazaguanine reductase